MAGPESGSPVPRTMLIDLWNSNGTQTIFDERMVAEALIEASALFQESSQIGVRVAGRCGVSENRFLSFLVVPRNKDPKAKMERR